MQIEHLPNGYMRAFIGGPNFRAYLEALKSIPGRTYDKSTRGWLIPSTGHCALTLMESIREIDPAWQADERMLSLIRYRQNFVRVIEDPRYAEPIPGTKYKSLPHQSIGSRLIASTDAVFLAWDMGTGKTKAVIDAIVKGRMQRVLVCCPKAVVGHWGREWAKHGTDDYRILLLSRRKGKTTEMTVKQKADLLYKSLGFPDPMLVVVNYDAVWRSELGKLVAMTDWDLVVADESTKIKSPKGKASKFFEAFRHKARHRVALSGTPIQSSREDLFAQLRWLEPGIFGSHHGAFMKTWFDLDDSAVKMFAGGRSTYTTNDGRNLHEAAFRTKPKADQVFHDRFHLVAHRVHRNEVLNLPEFRDQTRLVELGERARMTYDEVVGSFIADVEGGSITVGNALVELLRLQQIVSGGVRFDGTDDVEIIDTAKRDCLIELLEELPPAEPVVVFCVFHFELDLVREAAKESGRTCCELSGRVSELEEWQAGENLDRDVLDAKYDGTVPTVIAVQIQAGGMGIDLTRACYNVYLSTGFSYGLVEQSRARSNRQGQTREGIYIRIAAADSIDQHVDGILKRKAAEAASIVETGDSLAKDMLGLVRSGAWRKPDD